MPSLRSCRTAGPVPPFRQQPYSGSPFTYSEIFEVISAASNAAQKAGYGCYLFGGAAVYFTCPDHPRTPEDIDLFVFRLSETGQPTPSVVDAERVKLDIQRQDVRFYRVINEETGMTDAPLWFSFSDNPQIPDFSMSIKVNIFPVGGDQLKLPLIPWNKLMWTFHPPTRYRGFFVMPPFALLIAELKAWHDNISIVPPRPNPQRSTTIHRVDVQALLDEVVKNYRSLGLTGQGWIPAWFIGQGREHAKEFLASHPDLGHDAAELRRWVNLGLIDGLEGLEIQRKSTKVMQLVRYVQVYLDETFGDDSDAGPAKEYLMKSLMG